jgi:multisubunit Na+/H+ antiporter MnhB subunit
MDKKSAISLLIDKLLVAISVIVLIALGASFSLWRAGKYNPDLQFSAVLFGVPSLGFYFAAVVNLLRLRSRMKLSVDKTKSGQI